MMLNEELIHLLNYDEKNKVKMNYLYLFIVQ
jgi:hypothetical protein